MNILSPSILAANFNHLGDDIAATKLGGAAWTHIDVMDGDFVPQISFGQPLVKSIRKGTDLFFDVHLMVDHPETYVPEFADCGADGITFHLEAAKDPDAVIAEVRKAGKRVGISVKPGTPLDEVYPYLDRVDMLLIMTVEPGFGGQKFIPESLSKIAEARRFITEKGLPVDIEIDGGVTLDNIEMTLEAGANVIVAGSAVYRGNIQENTEKFMKILKENER